MKQIIVYIILLFSCMTVVDAQTLERRAEIAYEQKNYRLAADAYLKHIEKRGDLEPEMCLPLANSFYYLNEYDNALTYYEKAPKSAYIAADYFNYGELLRRQKKYTKAKEIYAFALAKPTTDILKKRIVLGQKACDWAAENYDKKNVQTVTVAETGIKTNGQSLGVSYYKEGIVYSAADSAKEAKVDERGTPIQTLHYATKAGDRVADGQLLSDKFDKGVHVGAAEFSDDYSTLYFTRLVELKGGAKLKIFSSKYNTKIKDWDKEVPLPFCNDRYNYAHPALSNDGKTLYFSSDQEGSLGGMDIFEVQKLANGWSPPVNLGSMVNTAGSEVFPYITPNGSLSFSSNGHTGFGGLDAFWVKMRDGVPYELLNAYRPINSSYDDFAAVIDPEDSLVGYVSTNRGSEGLEDEILTVSMTADYDLEISGIDLDSLYAEALRDTLYQERVQDSLSLVEAKYDLVFAAVVANVRDDTDDVSNEAVAEFLMIDENCLYGAEDEGVIRTYMFDAISLQPIRDGKFKIVKTNERKTVLTGHVDSSGYVELDMKEAKMLEKQPLSITVKTEDGDYNRFVLELVSDGLKRYNVGCPILLTPIMVRRESVKEAIVAGETLLGGAPFERGNVELTAAGMRYMDAWAEFLIQNPSKMIKLKTHTDSRGNVSSNFKLSQVRAYQAKKYLISKGVNHLQIIARGYGERYPLVDCVTCTEKDYELNRRIEVEVLELAK